MDNFFNIENLSGGYYREAIVKDISLKIKKGDFLGIIGPNGSGKTTFLRLLSRVLLPQQGKVHFLGTDIATLGLKEFAQKVAYVAQDSLINFPFTVWEIVLMGRTPYLKRWRFESKNDLLVAQDALALTDTLYLKEKYINELSSGERQRVIIARALAQEPVLLFLDEPTAHLDIGHQIQIMDLLKKLNSEIDLTIVMVLHDLNLASEYCNRLVLFNQGRIFKEGSCTEVLTYQNIEAVYQTLVIVNKNPLNHKPFVILVSAKTREH